MRRPNRSELTHRHKTYETLRSLYPWPDYRSVQTPEGLPEDFSLTRVFRNASDEYVYIYTDGNQELLFTGTWDYELEEMLWTRRFSEVEE